jgi:hypothetical protein
MNTTIHTIRLGSVQITVEVVDDVAPPAPGMSPGWLKRFTSECPEGWNTVLGYLASTNPEALFLMDPDAEATKRDGYWLINQCKKLGIEPVKVRAPAHLIEQGIFEVNAYPEWLLARRLG